MITIVIGDGLTSEFLSPEVQFQASLLHVGLQEIDRLMGSGQDFGTGPLPTFLQEVAAANGRGVNTSLLLLQSSEDSTDVAFIEPLREVAKAAEVLQAPHPELPLHEFRAAVERLTGVDPLMKRADKSDLHFLLVGCHTEKRILSIAMFLKNILGYANVAVCLHLVGSSTKAAHFAALRHIFLSAGITVFLDLKEAASFVDIDPALFDDFSCKPCIIEPAEALKSLGKEQKSIIEYLCMHWTRTKLKPLQGGFSGSLLFLADGWKKEARTEPMVLKIDHFKIMRRELEGYQQVFDYFGKHIPTFSNPVSIGDFIGIGMELATMEGNPETLQDSFELAQSEDEVGRFMGRLDKALELSTVKLYRNTHTRARVAPYRDFHLHTDQQLQWLRENVANIVGYCKPGVRNGLLKDYEIIGNILKLIAANEDSLESDVCLAHGDLNLKNIICDESDNVWFIDWTHCGHHPAAMDFAKLENDIKFVISKQFDLDDLPQLKIFEDYLLSRRVMADTDELPENMKFAELDLRYRKILVAVRKIRETCFSLKNDDDWLIYRTALLKYALHTLSFDARRNQGECDPTQLLHALYSLESLVFILVADDFHLKIRGERPASYPPRLRILIDEAPWGIECPDYAPPYHVDPSVLENDSSQKSGGWADPEDFAKAQESADQEPATHQEETGRQLNPRGRTGIAGRGLLGKWGPNDMVSAVVTRIGGATDKLDIVLGRIGENGNFLLPKGFVASGETFDDAMARVLAHEIGWQDDSGKGDVIVEGYRYDPRQTDHAWVEMHGRLLHQDTDSLSFEIRPGGSFKGVDWCPLDAEIVNKLPANQAALVREAVKRLLENGCIAKTHAKALLSKTG
jgi:ADP-ribose pyrophosphatase